MLTQQDIVNRLNQLTLRYNLTWDDIKYDADKAIVRINNFMGTKYPKMSEHLVAPDSTYTVNAGGVLYEIFPEEYIHGIVIPFIAMEVLARDEEFTTIYNKYHKDVEDSLFDMFQNEFNKVPYVFRQNPDQGVFFTAGNRADRFRRNDKEQLPTFKFRVYYHTNTMNIAGVQQDGVQQITVEDTYAYEYGDKVIVRDYEHTLLSYDGTMAYSLLGWAYGRNLVTETLIEPGTELTIKSDIHLYAQWTSEPTLNIFNDEVSIKNNYRETLTNLIIPDYIGGQLVQKISSYFCGNPSIPGEKLAHNLLSITLPTYLTHIKTRAFDGFKGNVLVFKPSESSVTIDTLAFNNTPNLTSIVIPENVETIKAGAFPVVSAKRMTIYCRKLQDYAGYVTGWYAPSDSSVNYTVEVKWGYNG